MHYAWKGVCESVYLSVCLSVLEKEYDMYALFRLEATLGP
jgi:hypothetical protein